MRRFYQLVMLGSLILSLGLPSAQATGANVQKYRFGNTVYTVKKVQPADSHLTKRRIQRDLHQLRAQTLRDIKTERAEHVSTSIKVSPKLTRLANLRAKQVAKHFTHYNRDHKPMTTIDARRAGLPHAFQGSENIASSGLGNCTIIADPKTYHNRDGKDMANMSNDGMMNYDQFEQNGHRKNILSRDNTLIGVGAAYSYHKHTFYLTEDFGNHDPQSSEDVNKPNLRIHLKHAQSIGTIVKRYYYQVVRFVHSLF